MTLFISDSRNRSDFYLSLGFVLLALSVCARTVPQIVDRTSNAGIYVSAPLLCIGMLSILNAVRLSRMHLSNIFLTSSKNIFILLIIWSVVTILRGFEFELIVIRDMWGISVYAWALLVPITVVLGADIQNWRVIFRLLFLFGWWGLLAFILTFFLMPQPNDLYLAYGCTILLLFSSFFSFKKTFYRSIIFSGTIVTILTSIFSLIRSQVIEKGLFILFTGAIFFLQKHQHKTRRRIFVLFTAAIIFVALVYMMSVDTIPFIPPSVNDSISAFKEKLPQNTRIVGQYNLYREFLEDVKGTDLLIGRGCLGQYFGYVGSFGPAGIDRREIECGYFQVVLNGGIIMLGLMLYLSLTAIWLGFFRSQNWFSKACASIVLIRLVVMVPAGLPDANIFYIIFWMAIGACFSINIRCATDEDITKLIQPSRYSFILKKRIVL